MTELGYIVIGSLMLLDIITIALCKMLNNEEFIGFLEFILFGLIGLVLCTIPV